VNDHGFLSGAVLDDKYRIEKLLGRGGMGSVYRATHLGTKRPVAIKVINAQFSNKEEFVERFRREAEAAGRLRHPNVVDVTDFGFAQTGSGRVAYLVMEYLDGCTLSEVLAEERRLPREWVVDILEQICSAVGEAHRLGIIHRDLKPDNIWLEPNHRGGYTIKVLDFGLVKLSSPALVEIESRQQTAGLSPQTAMPSTSSDSFRRKAPQPSSTPSSDLTESPTLIHSPVIEEAGTLIQRPSDAAPLHSPNAKQSSSPESPPVDNGVEVTVMLKAATGERETIETAAAADLTRLGSVMGTPLYMSPEQCLGGRVDAKSDIYSLGVIAYRMLSGETPFAGSFDELIRLHTRGEPQPIREKNRKVPERMARLVMAALAKDPAQRPESAAGFASALRASAEGSGSLLRQAISLYSERFPTFLKLSLLAYAPLIAAVAFIYLSDEVISWEKLSPSSLVVFVSLMFSGIVVTNLLAHSIISAVSVPIVIQLIMAPLRPVRIRTAFAALRRRWWAFTVATIAVMAMILLGTAFFVIPGLAALACYALYAPVVAMEGHGVRATLKRARSLMRRSWSTVLIITILQFTLPLLVWLATVDATISLKLADDFSPKEFNFGFSASGSSSLYQLLNILVTPLTAIMSALLYLKTRQAGGESLKDAMEQFDALEIPRSKWQARMRNRSVSPVPRDIQPGS
jgi:serine/threonine protein kinase